MLIINEVLLAQIIKNLLNNAVESLSEFNTKQPCVWLRCEVLSGVLKIHISDNGVGIPSDLQSSIFDAFFTTKKEGTSIGLSLVSRICESAGGFIEYIDPVEGSDSLGAHFCVTLPI